MSLPLVSVIIPTHNRFAFLKKAVGSVYAQTYAHFELIVVDDGSTDNTANIVKLYDNRLHYIKQNNSGVAAARNRAIAKARGDYIAFLDDDDLYEPTKLQECVNYMQAHPDVVWLYSGFSFIDAQGKPLDRAAIIPEKETVTLHDIAMFAFIATPSVMVRTHTLKEAGGFPDGIKVSEDYDTWARVLARGKGTALKTALVNIRLHKGNTVLPTGTLLKQNTRIIDSILALSPPDCLPRQHYINNLRRIIAESLRHKKQYIRYVCFVLLTKIRS